MRARQREKLEHDVSKMNADRLRALDQTRQVKLRQVKQWTSVKEQVSAAKSKLKSSCSANARRIANAAASDK
eukprot:6214015-Pleurochrysis_carterae.AAC.1